MKKILLLITFLFSILSWGQTTDLFISEYVEGSGNNKYIEIYNGTGATVNLSDYRLRLYANGASIPTNDVLLSGTLADGAVVVYKNNSATAYLGTATINAAVNFNGDDALALFKISTNANVDIFGVIGNDPGTEWTATGYSTLDKTLVRKNNVCGGITVNPSGTGATAFTTLSTEWDIYNQDTVSNLGSHSASCLTGKVSFTNGDWNVATTWTPVGVPTSTDNVTILSTHTVYTTIPLVRNGNTQVNGTFELRTGGYASGTGIFTYNATTGSLNFNTAASYGINNTDVYWPTTNGPFNVGVLSGGILLNAGANREVNGTFSTANGGGFGISFPAATLTLNGLCRIEAGGFFGNSPIFGASSTLRYNINGTYNRGLEWFHNGVGTIGSTPGYPNNIQVSNNTTFNYNNGTPLNKAIEGTLTIGGGSSFYMDFGGGASGGTLTVAGNILNNGNFTLGNAAGDDLRLNGNFTNNGVFNGNGRAIFFTRNGTQTVASSTALTIPYVVFQPASGSTTIQLLNNVTVSAPAAGNAISFSSAADIFDLNGNTLTIGTSGVANVISGAGTFKGSTTSNLSLLGTGSVGTLNFTTGSQIVNNLTLNRQTNVIGFNLGTDVSINGTLALTNGIANLANRTMIITIAGSISGASSSNYIIADYTAGGYLRKNFNANGSFIFPIGDRVASADGSQYSPATINFTGGTYSSGYVSLNVEDSKEPNNEAPTDFISRYWNLMGSGITAATYDFTATYLPVDINGTETNSKSGRYATSTSTWTEGPNLVGGSNTIILTGLTTATGALTSENHYTAGNPFKRAEINIQQGATNYLTGSTYNFGTQNVSSTTNVVFTVQNLGLENLNLAAATVIGGGAYTLSVNYGATVIPAGTTTFTISFNPLTAGTYTGSISIPNNDLTGSENPYIINFTGVGQNSALSDIITAGGESAIVPSTVNNATINTTADGVQVWRFTIRDGGTTSDADPFPTIVNSITLTQAAGNQVNDWADAIQAVALFNGATKIADGVVSLNQIVFTGAPLISVPDNGSVTLSLRLSVQTNPNNSGSNIDGDDFVFSISNSNAIAAVSGSQFTSFATASSINGQNVLSVIATQLTFIQQPTNSGVNTAMADVIVAATDVNGNIDLDFTGNISITSTGTLSVSPIVVGATSGTSTFSTIVHTTIGTLFNLNASATGLLSSSSGLFDITNVTTLALGDLAVLAVNTNNGAGEEFAFVCFQDILPGTEFFITDNGYERVTAGLWGDTEGVIKIRRIGTTLPKGTIINIVSNGNVNVGSDFDVITCGVVDTNWIKDEITSGSFALNKDDQIWFIQGGSFVDPPGSHNATFTGTVLYGWTDIAWKTAPGYASTAGSTIFPGLYCFNTDVNNPLSGNSFVKFNDPVDPDFSTATNARLDWIALINNPANWDSYTNTALYSASGYDYRGNTTCAPLIITASGYVNGKWTGRQDTNWFNCGNWDTLKVPDETVDVLVEDTTYNNPANVDATAPFASTYGNVAKAKNLTITGEKVEVIANVNNILEVHGDLIIDGTGVLDMNDGNNATADGTIHLYGDWSNLLNETAFDQGNGTVHFDGTIPQIVTSLDAIGTEVFYNVILNNDFDTTISNNLIAQGDLTVNPTYLLTVQSDDYVQVNNKLQLDGDIVVENDGQLIQVNETDTNSGTFTGTKFQVKRETLARNLDYVYWSAPLEDFDVANLPNSHRYEWNPIVTNPNGTQGNWLGTSGIMTPGKGYIARASNGSTTPISLPITFQGGKPFNGQFSFPISRGSTVGSDDCWNLVGNPYPSAIDADLFLAENTNIEGSVRIWMHGTLPAVIPSPFYQNFQYNYDEDDYIVYNGTATSVPAVFNGKIASGQGFFIRMLEDGETDVDPPVSDIIPLTSDITFKNAYRSDAINGLLYNNSEFYKKNNATTTLEKSRIWIDLIASNNKITKTVIGYVPGATLAKDRMYDALIDVDAFKLYSLINTQKQAIQGRPVPFDNNDIVPLGIFIQTAGNYKLAISAVDGLFSDASQNIYLEDKLLNVIHDLRQAPYDFSTLVGEFNNRFVLRYTNTVLSNPDFESTNDFVIVSNDKVMLSSSELIQSVTVYDLLGRTIYTKENINSTFITLEGLQKSKVALIVKTTFENGLTVSKKVIF